MDTFFCMPSAYALEAAVPALESFEIFSVCGENGWAKQELFRMLSTEAKERRIPCVRAMDAHYAGRTVAVGLPLQRRIAVDGTYFSAYLAENAEKIRFSLHTDAFTDNLHTADCAESNILKRIETKSYARAEVLLQSAARKKQEAAETLLPYGDKARLASTVLRWAETYLPPRTENDTAGKILFRRTLGGITEWGVHTVHAPFSSPNWTRILLCDPLGCFAPALLDGFSAACTACGYNVRLYRCALRGVTEYLTVPSLGLAVCTENTAHPFPFTAHKTVHAESFLKNSTGDIPYSALLRGLHAAEALLDEAAFSLYEAAEARRAREAILETHTDEMRFLPAKQLLHHHFFKFGKMTKK